jgi:hypothetical protein
VGYLASKKTPAKQGFSASKKFGQPSDGRRPAHQIGVTGTGHPQQMQLKNRVFSGENGVSPLEGVGHQAGDPGSFDLFCVVCTSAAGIYQMAVVNPLEEVAYGVAPGLDSSRPGRSGPGSSARRL